MTTGRPRPPADPARGGSMSASPTRHLRDARRRGARRRTRDARRAQPCSRGRHRSRDGYARMAAARPPRCCTWVPVWATASEPATTPAAPAADRQHRRRPRDRPRRVRRAAAVRPSPGSPGRSRGGCGTLRDRPTSRRHSRHGSPDRSAAAQRCAPRLPSRGRGFSGIDAAVPALVPQNLASARRPAATLRLPRAAARPPLCRRRRRPGPAVWPQPPRTGPASPEMSDCSGASNAAWSVAWSPTMLTIPLPARRALCRFAMPLPRPGPGAAAWRPGGPPFARTRRRLRWRPPRTG